MLKAEPARSTMPKRTTLILRPDDQENLAKIAQLQGGIPDAEAIRRSLKLTSELLKWSKDGGQIILQRGRTKERLRFL